jgi:anti-sigma regulatory factor (Ser/Thr protein kinase)
MVGSFEMQVEHDAKALAPFRHKLDRWLAISGLGEAPRADVVLASHEAVANAIEHSNSLQPVLVKADAHRDGFVVEIVDDGRWRPARKPSKEGRGRGLALIKALVTDVQINSLSAGTTVRLFQLA